MSASLLLLLLHTSFGFGYAMLFDQKSPKIILHTWTGFQMGQSDIHVCWDTRCFTPFIHANKVVALPTNVFFTEWRKKCIFDLQHCLTKNQIESVVNLPRTRREDNVELHQRSMWVVRCVMFFRVTSTSSSLVSSRKVLAFWELDVVHCQVCVVEENTYDWCLPESLGNLTV